MKRVLALLLAVIMTFALAACGQSAAAPAEEAPAAEAPTEVEAAESPNVLRFTTVDSDGNEWSDEAFADAKVTMLNLWAYWCPPCVGEMPDLQKLSEDYADRGFQILGVSMEEYEADNVAKMAELGVAYPCLRLTESLYAVLNTSYVPSTIFVDSEGQILGEVVVGSNNYEGWAAIIEGYLS